MRQWGQGEIWQWDCEAWGHLGLRHDTPGTGKILQRTVDNDIMGQLYNMALGQSGSATDAGKVKLSLLFY